MPSMRLKHSPGLYVGEESLPKPVLVATAKSHPRKNLVDQAAAFTAVVARSLEAAVKRNPQFPLGLSIAACLEEAPPKSTMHGYLVAKFTIVNPVIIDSLAKLTDSSPLLPIQNPNPGFDAITLSWENRIGQYYRTLHVPPTISIEGLVSSINETLPCKYVEAQKGPGGYVVTGQHVVEFTVSSATDIPNEITIPNPTRGKQAFSIRVVHVPIVDNKMANKLSAVPLSEWEDMPGTTAWNPAGTNPASVSTPNRQAFPASGRPNNQRVPATGGASKGGTSSSKNGKAVKHEPKLDYVAQQRVIASAAKYKAFKGKVASNDKAAAAKKVEDERIAAEAAAAAAKKFQAAKAAAEKEQAESELYVRNFVLSAIEAAFEQHAPAEAVAMKNAAAPSAVQAAAAAVAANEEHRIERSKRIRANSDKDEDEEDDEDILMKDADTATNAPKKAKETGGEDRTSPMNV